MAGDSELERLDRTFRGEGAIEAASAAARSFGEAQGAGQEDIARLCLVVEEWFANLYDHGGLAPTDEVRLELATHADGIRVVMTDPGQSFDPRTLPGTVDIPDRGGGAGIGIMRAWARLVGYDVTDRGNRLELRLPLHPGAMTPSPGAPRE